MGRLTINCNEATLLISKKEEKKLSFKQRIQLVIHLGVCGLCKLFAKQNKIIIATSKKIPEPQNLSLSELDKKQIIEKLTYNN